MPNSVKIGAVPHFCDIAGRFKKGEAGKDFLVLKDELEGYESTPLEQELVRAYDGLEKELRESPASLSAPMLGALFTALTDLSPAADGYRARMMKAAGDYADEDSPAKNIGEKTLSLILTCLRAAEQAGRNPLAELPQKLLETPISLDSRGRFAGPPIFRRLYREDMSTFRHPAFAPLFAADHRAITERVTSLEGASDAEKRRLLRELIGLSIDTDLEGKKLVDKALLAALEDPCPEVRYEAQNGLESARTRIYPGILKAMESPFPATRCSCVRILLTLYLECWDSAVKKQVRENLTEAMRDHDKTVAKTASDAIQKINWRER